MRFTLLLASLLLTSATSAQGAATLRLGYFPNLTHAAALVGVGRGTFQKALGSTRLDVRTFSSGTTLSEAFAAGQLDIAYIGPGPAISAASRGMPVQFLAGAANAGAVLVARKDSGIKLARDLNGKTVAVPSLGNTQDISLRHLLSASNLKTKENGGGVTIVSVPPADIVAAFAGKRADAALVPEPWGAALEAQGNPVIGDEKTVWRGGNYPSALVIVNTKFAQANPGVVSAFVKVHNDATGFLNKSPAAAQAAVNAELEKLTGSKLDPRVLQRAWSRTHFTAALDINALKEYAALNVEAGYARTIPDFSALIRP
ncbi:ABC transporter substrate-binding protein [Deinococcus sp.]|uniref:ABC transporter substrate-binding protein n=1 Tax=Deinococcus sp. TaxID=47478 RepID=UPI0025C1C2FC|nr:ABC transporter substrate-binding protein [Deinococcus sp.]